MLDALSALNERHEQEKFAHSRLTEGEQARAQLANLLRYRAEPWHFLRECVSTLDQVDQSHPIKPFPAYLEYLELFAHVWHRKKLIAAPKSRRMTFSWSCIALYLADTIFNQGRFNGFVSKKEDDSAELVERAEFIYRRIPEWRLPTALLPKLKNDKMTKSPPVLDFEELNSKIQGFPMGANQLRQFTFSGLFGDEAAFWEEAQQFYSSSQPTLEGGGRLTLVSSRSPGFFKKIVFDQLDAEDLNFPEIPPAPVKRPIEGIEIWENPKNKFLVFDTHYTANPAKRGDAWREAVRASLPARDFAMEYEKSWQTYEGKPVYGDYSGQLHVSAAPLRADPSLPLLLGWDFGLTPACVVAQITADRLNILREYIGAGGTEKFASAVRTDLMLNYSTILQREDGEHNFVDPAGFQKAQTDERTCVSFLTAAGFRNIKPGPVLFTERIRAVEHFLLRIQGGHAALQLDPTKTPVLTEGFGGGYQYGEKALNADQGDLRPNKNRFSHPHDALQYLCWGAKRKLKEYHLNLRTPEYGFQKVGSA